MDKDKIDKIRAVKITTVLGIPETGRRISMRCPLDGHKDKTASFYIYPDNSWCCYGLCNKTGQNAIDLLIAMGASFTEAVEELQKYC